MYERLNRGTDSALAYRITRPMSREEIKQITDELEGTIAASGSVRILLDLQAFPYESLGAMWDDLKFEARHARSIDRLALVGGGRLERWAAKAVNTVLLTTCRCFAEDRLEEAWAWLIAD